LVKSHYVFEAIPERGWIIVECLEEGPLDYDCEYDTYDDALHTVQYIRWLEKVYSPKRK
jgi:hypothetical protein